MKDRIAGVLLGLQSDIWDYLVLHLKCVNEDNHIYPAVGGINELYGVPKSTATGPPRDVLLKGPGGAATFFML